jgi:hypothetical protein
LLSKKMSVWQFNQQEERQGRVLPFFRDLHPYLRLYFLGQILFPKT